MNPMQPPLDEHKASNTEHFGIHLPDLDAHTLNSPKISFGHRLHAARESRGLDLETCAHALKLPVRVLRQLERDACDDLDSKVYLASYIGKYGRYLGINQASIQVELDRLKQNEPALVATGGISHSRFLFDRYATAATYVVLTAVIVVPMIWLGVRGTLDRNITHLAPLDAAPVAQQDVPGAVDKLAPVPTQSSVSSSVVDKPAASLQQPAQQPLLASMAAFPGMDSAPSVAPTATTAIAADTGSHMMEVSLAAPSWVEVVSSDGHRLEYGLLPAGSDMSYRSDQPLDVRIGNTTGAQIRLDGAQIALDDFRHANVAHFRVQLEDGKASAVSL